MIIIGKPNLFLKIKTELFFLKLRFFKHIRKLDFINLIESQKFFEGNPRSTFSFNEVLKNDCK